MTDYDIAEKTKDEPKELRHRSIHELRTMAQAFEIEDIFEKTAVQLAQAIEAKQERMVKPVVELPERNEYDARLMTLTPADRGSAVDVVEMLAPHIALGLKLSFEDECWYMAHGCKTDSGSLRMPLRHILLCAENVLK